MTFFSSFKTFLFPCQAKKATIPTRLTLMIWHKKLFLLNQVWKFNFLAGNFEIVKLLCLHVRRRKPLLRHGWHLMIWHKNETFFSMIFFPFWKKSFLAGNYEIVKLLCISASVEESHYQWGGTNDLTIDIKWNFDFSFFKSSMYLRILKYLTRYFRIKSRLYAFTLSELFIHPDFVPIFDK